MQSKFWLFVFCLTVNAVPVVGLAATCTINGGSPTVTSPINSATHLNGAICGSTVTGAGCQLTLSANATSSSNADCLTIGRGVRVIGQDKEFVCTGSACGRAIVVLSGSSGTTQIDNVKITGCWSKGIYSNQSNVAADAADIEIDLECSGVNSGVGIEAIKNVERSIVSHTTKALYLPPSANVTDVVLFSNTTGVEATGSNITLTGVRARTNTYSFRKSNSSIGDMDVRRSVIRDAASCHCINDGTNTCGSLTVFDCVGFSGSWASFVDNTIHN